MSRNAVTAGVMVALLAGCAIGTISKDEDLYHHVVRMERDGNARNMTTGERMKIEEFENGQLKAIVEKIAGNDKLDTVMVYVHGAPLIGDISVKENIQKMNVIRAQGGKVYPILFNWDGSLGDVYSDHLYRIRNGQIVSKPRGVLTSPFYLLGDFFAGFAIFPGMWAEQTERVAEVEYPGLDRSGEKKLSIQRQLSEGKDANCRTPLKISQTMRHVPETSLKTGADVVRSVPILATSSFLASVGRSAWKNYNRRVNMAVRRASEFNKEDPRIQTGDEKPTGMFAVLMDSILKAVAEMAEAEKAEAEKAVAEKAEAKKNMKIVLIAHSAGTKIVSEYLATVLQRSEPGTNNPVAGADRIEEIVFLGSASTVREASGTIFPFLKANENTEFANFSLNAYHEEKTTWGAILLTGSILEWLDDSVAQPASHVDRVFGKWENVMLASHTIPCDIRERVHLVHLPKMKGFPRKHDELDDRISNEYNPFEETSWRVEKGGSS